MTDQNEMIVYPDKMRTSEPLSFEDIHRNRKLIKECLRGTMIQDVDYGLIPGCGDKPSLFKPGAEKLMLLFKLGCFLDVDDRSTEDCIKYIVKTRIVHIPTGIELGIGVGACSSDEEKYKWKKSVCQEEFESLGADLCRVKWYKGKDGKANYYVNQVRTNPADLNNTILKMAAKRSKIDGVITTTAASDILAQDLEEDAVRDSGDKSDPLQKPQEKPQEATKDSKIVPVPFRPMQSKYDGACKQCGDTITKNMPIKYREGFGAYHVHCASDIEKAEAGLDAK